MQNFNIIPYPDPRLPSLGNLVGAQTSITKALIERELEGNTPLLDGDGDDVVTIIDTLSIPFQEIGVTPFLEKLQSKFGVNLQTQEGLEKISRIYHIALNYFNGYLERSVPKVFLGKNLDTYDEIVSFLNSTSAFGGENTYRQTYCDLSKIMFSILEIERMGIPLEGGKLVESFNSFILKKYKKVILGTSGGVIFGSIPKVLRNGKGRSAYFQLENRAKNLNAIISKLLAKPDLSAKDAVNDFLGIRLTSGSTTDALFLLEWEFIHIYKRRPQEFRQKYFISSEEIHTFLNNYEEDLDPQFVNALKVTLKGKSRVKNNPDFQDIKLLGSITLDRKSYNFESQHFLSNNKNEIGLSNHTILELYRKIEVIERLEGYVSSNYILRIIESFLKRKYGAACFQNVDILSEHIRIHFSPKNNNKVFSGFPSSEVELKLSDIGFSPKYPNYQEIHKLLKELKGIYYYLTSKLVRVSIKDQRTGINFYKVENRLRNQHKEGVLPKGIQFKKDELL